MTQEIRFSEDGKIIIVWDSESGPVRCPNQEDMDNLPVGEDMTEEEMEFI